MKNFRNGGLSRLLAGSAALSPDDLVRRTLSQHGLMPGPDTTSGLAGRTGLSDLLTQHLPGGLSGPARVPPPPVPGASFTEDRFSCAAGSRAFLTYVPASIAKDESPAGLVMMLHGCGQTHADFAAGTAMNDLAERHRLVIIYPQQSRGDNAQSCWNWFSPGDQRRGGGEPAILADLAQDVVARHAVPPGRIFVAGLSAGAAMAVVLGQTYGDRFAAIGVHSGLPHGAAHDMPSAFAAMAGRGVEPAGAPGSMTPTILFHGSADQVVAPVNADRIARAVLDAAPGQALLQHRDGTEGGRHFRQDIATIRDGAALLERWTVEGLGHAWSGGRPTGSHTDPAGPDASAHMVRFFLQTDRRPA